MGDMDDASTTGTATRDDADAHGSLDPAPHAIRPLRVLRVITRLNVGGPATHVTVADRGLAARGWETLLVHGVVESNEEEIDVAGLDLPTKRVPTLHRAIDPAADARSLATLARIIRAYRPQVIHTHLSKAGLVGRAAALATSRAVRIHTFHGNVFGGYFSPRVSRAILALERGLGRSTQRIVALSERQRAELLELGIGRPERIRIVPLGLDLGRFANPDRDAARARLGIPADAVLVLAMGRLVPIKRLDRLVDAAALAAPKVPGLRVAIVGGGDEQAALEARISERGLGDIVHLPGWSTDTPTWYAAADMVTLTSDREGTPLALIEAAAAGRPVVAGDVGGVADIVVDGETGFVVAHDDVPAYAERIVRLASDPALRARMASAAPIRATAFSADRLVGDLDTLYHEALVERRGASRRALA